MTTKLNIILYKIRPKTLFVGQKIIYLPSCQSTNDEAAQLIAADEAVEGLFVVTDQQMAGRGQRGNVWQAEPGQNLTTSLILGPSFLAPTEQFWLNIAVSLGVTDALAVLLPADLKLCIKWPNDIFLDDQKLGGILIENTVQGARLVWSVVGMGLNVNQTEFAYQTATSLQNRAPLPDGYNLAGLLAALSERIEGRYLQLRANHRAGLQADYLSRLFRYHQEHWFRANDQRFRGIITGVDEAGQLQVLVNGVVQVFGFKEIGFEI
jgi:BirA family transcriptional regulator, biotin operon repressor / biotin---[acetyl-CoA-carboxylase] ligase